MQNFEGWKDNTVEKLLALNATNPDSILDISSEPLSTAKSDLSEEPE